MKKLTVKWKRIRFKEEKKRFLVFSVGLLLILFLATYLLQVAYARYEIRAKVNANISKALYIFESDKVRFNLDPEGIIPREEPYIYKFSVSNYNGSRHSDVDLTYQLQIRTTTNLPITISLYRNELYDAVGATNILQSPTVKQDEDDAFYRVYKTAGSYEMNYVDNVTDVYTIVIDFPSVYSHDLVYANYIESIEIYLESHQII